MAKSKEELISMIENDLVDPSTNKITGERVKNALTEMVDAMGTGGGGGAMEYWSVPAEVAEEVVELALYSPWAKFTYWGSTIIVSGGAIATFSDGDLLAFAIDWSAKVAIPGVDGINTVRELFDLMEIPPLADTGLIQITEEEFYTIS